MPYRTEKTPAARSEAARPRSRDARAAAADDPQAPMKQGMAHG